MQCKAKQSKAKQCKAKQSKAKQCEGLYDPPVILILEPFILSAEKNRFQHFLSFVQKQIFLFYLLCRKKNRDCTFLKISIHLIRFQRCCKVANFKSRKNMLDGVEVLQQMSS